MNYKLVPALALTALMATPAYAQHTGWLADNATMLGEQEQAQIRDAADKAYQATGARVCVRTISSSNGDDVKHVAVQTLNQWNPGPRSVLILVCLEPKMIYLQPGTDLKYVFESDVATGICRNTIAPHFKAGNHAAGLLAGIQAVQSRLMSPAGTTYTQNYQANVPWTFLGLTAKTWLIIIVVVVLLIFLIWLASKSNGYSSGYSSGGNSFFYYSSGGGSSDSSSSSGGSSWGDSGGSCDGGGGGGSSW